MDKQCNHEYLSFQAWLGAPGIGQSWVCDRCDEALWSPGGAEQAVPFKNLDPSVFILSAEDVI